VGALAALPIGLFLFAGALIYHPRTCFEEISSEFNRGTGSVVWKSSLQNARLPEAPVDSRVTKQDILQIGRALIGYRHVTGEKLAQENATKGIFGGCALNISFCGAESDYDKAPFKDLDLRVGLGEECQSLIDQYEKAITSFIANAISMDLQALSYEELMNSIESTRFMLIKPYGFKASDMSRFDGLGRWPKSNTPAKDVILLEPLRREEIPQEYNEKSCSSPNQLNTLFSYITSLYRRRLLHYLRTEFDPDSFPKLRSKPK
jgi:hypothetical protein